jgi:hypothetical protein
MKIKLLVLGLICTALNAVHSQEFGVKKKDVIDTARYRSTAIPVANRLIPTLSIPSLPCVISFVNQTVMSNTFVTGCNILGVQNVTVANGVNLSLYAPKAINFDGTFEVADGGVLNVVLNGDKIECPIVIGEFGSSFTYFDAQNTVKFTNEYVGRPSNDVFYRFTLTVPMVVTIKHCGSSIDTYMHLLDESGTLIASNDDYSGTGHCDNILHSYLNVSLSAGTYHIVSEGYSENGNIQTAVTGTISPIVISYTYDASGNRTARLFGVTTSSMAAPDNSSKVDRKTINQSENDSNNMKD